MDCLFCKIAAGQLNTVFVHQDDQIVAFNDIHPQAPHHVLIIPREHIATVNDLTLEKAPLIGQMITTAQQIAKKLGIAEDGYRLVFNCNAAAGQLVYHIHLHLLGGRHLTWPPG